MCIYTRVSRVRRTKRNNLGTLREKEVIKTHRLISISIPHPFVRLSFNSICSPTNRERNNFAAWVSTS